MRIKTILMSAATSVLMSFPALAEMLDVEKDELKLGFIKLTDMAPLAIAYEKGFFEDDTSELESSFGRRD